MRHPAWLVIGAVGCGRIGFDTGSLPRYSAPVLISQVSEPTARDDDPTATSDELELYFNSDRSGGLGMADVYVSRRDSTDLPWGTPMLVVGLSTSGADNNPEVSGDGLTMYLSRPLAGTGDQNIYVATRTSRNDAWSSPVLVDDVNSTADEYQAAASNDGVEIAVTSTRLRQPGMSDVFLATRTGAGWSAPTRIDLTLQSPADAMISGDNRFLFFHAASGDIKPYAIERPARGSPFGAPRLLGDLDTAGDDTDLWVSPDLELVLLARDTGSGVDIYEAHAL